MKWAGAARCYLYNSYLFTTTYRIANITTMNRIAIITTINRIAIITTINRPERRVARAA